MILVTGDWHIRDKEGLDALDRVIQVAYNRRPDLVAVCGDVFHSSRPGSEMEKEVARRLKELSKMCPVVGVSGNHDSTSRAAATDTMDILSPSISIASAPRIVQARGYYIVCIPWLRPNQILANEPRLQRNAANAKLASTVEAMVTGYLTDAPDGAVKVLIAHCTTLGADYGGYIPTSLGGELIWNTDWFSGYDVVCLGHIHKAQIVAPNAAYCGSTYRNTIAERDVPKGVYIWDGKWEWEPIWARPMYLVEGTPDEVEIQVATLPDGADVQVRVQLQPHDDWYGMDGSRFHKFQVHQVIEREGRPFAQDPWQSMSVPEALRRYFEIIGKEESEIDLLMSAFAKLEESKNGQ